MCITFLKENNNKNEGGEKTKREKKNPYLKF